MAKKQRVRPNNTVAVSWDGSRLVTTAGRVMLGYVAQNPLDPGAGWWPSTARLVLPACPTREAAQEAVEAAVGCLR